LIGQLACENSRKLNDTDNFDRFFFFEQAMAGGHAIFPSDPM
jgi:hypothetical protein